MTVDELANAREAGKPVRVLDVRWRLDAPDGTEAFRAGHIPGAVYVDLDRELADHSLPVAHGRHPLPTASALQESARAWGVCDGDTVVVYDDLGNMSSARAWWLLKHAGIEDVRVLDGAFAAWKRAGLPVERGDGTAPIPGNVVLEYGAMPVLTAREAAAIARSGSLVDARAGERYRGEVEPIDPRAGHIPGALSAPTNGNLDADGSFLAVDALRRRFADAGVDPAAPVGAYCGSGVTASHTVLALHLAGIPAALYPGSWSEWSRDPDAPVATGEQP